MDWFGFRGWSLSTGEQQTERSIYTLLEIQHSVEYSYDVISTTFLMYDITFNRSRKSLDSDVPLICSTLELLIIVKCSVKARGGGIIQILKSE